MPASPSRIRCHPTLAFSLAIAMVGCAQPSAPPAGLGWTPSSPPKAATPAPSSLMSVEGVSDPRGLAIDAQGNLWLINGASGSAPAGRVLKLASDGTVLNRIDLGAELGACALDGTGTLWAVSSTPSAALWKISSTGTSSVAIATGSSPADLRGLVADASGSVWLADAANGLVSRFKDGARELVVTIPASDSMDPSGLAIAGDALWVASKGDRRVYKRRLSDGSELGSLVLPAPAAGPIAVDKNGLIWASHAFVQGTLALSKFSDAPELKQDYDVAQDIPNALIGDNRGYLWALLREKSQVVRLTPANGDTLRYEHQSIVRPAAIAVDTQGNAWIASPGATGSLTRIPAAP